jgi:hypothetical protein
MLGHSGREQKVTEHPLTFIFGACSLSTLLREALNAHCKSTLGGETSLLLN